MKHLYRLLLQEINRLQHLKHRKMCQVVLIVRILVLSQYIVVWLVALYTVNRIWNCILWAQSL